MKAVVAYVIAAASLSIFALVDNTVEITRTTKEVPLKVTEIHTQNVPKYRFKAQSFDGKTYEGFSMECDTHHHYKVGQTYLMPIEEQTFTYKDGTTKIQEILRPCSKKATIFNE